MLGPEPGEWPTRPWSARTGTRAERLPNVLVFDDRGREVTRLEAEEFDRLDVLVAELADVPVPTVVDLTRSDLADTLARITHVLDLHGYLEGPVAWAVRADHHAETVRVPTGTRCAIVVTPSAGHAVQAAKVFDPASAIVARELTVYGDAEVAARALVDVPVARVLADQLGDDLLIYRQPVGADAMLAAVPFDVAAATCLRLSPPIARRASLRAMWDRGRSAAEPEANRVFSV